MYLLTKNELKNIISDKKIIQNGKIENIEGIKYDLCISPKLLSQEYPTSIDISKMEYKAQNQVSVSPGELVFLLTEEIINLPKNMMGTLATKRKMNHEGVMVLGGSVVDPLYSGRLLFGLYNFSSAPFSIIPGKKIMSLMLHKLNKDEVADFPTPEIRINDFPDDLLGAMAKYKPTSHQQTETKLEKVIKDLEHIQRKINDNESFFKDFKESLKTQKEQTDATFKNFDKVLTTQGKQIAETGLQVKQISDSLKQEKEERKESYKDLNKKIKDKDQNLDVKIEKLNENINEKFLKVTEKNTISRVLIGVFLILVGAAIVKYLFNF